MSAKKIGIYSGAFDPVHAGHISFALQAIEHAKLDKLYFLPERRPRQKPGVEHFAHRVAMIKHASLPYEKFYVLESVETKFSVKRTLPMLKQKFQDDQLVFLFGSDAVADLPQWPHIEQMLTSCELVIAAREGSDTEQLQELISGWPVAPKSAVLLNSFAPKVSSTTVRHGLRSRQPVSGLLKSVVRYCDNHWLYVSVDSARSLKR